MPAVTRTPLSLDLTPAKWVLWAAGSATPKNGKGQYGGVQRREVGSLGDDKGQKAGKASTRRQGCWSKRDRHQLPNLALLDVDDAFAVLSEYGSRVRSNDRRGCINRSSRGDVCITYTFRFLLHGCPWTYEGTYVRSMYAAFRPVNADERRLVKCRAKTCRLRTAYFIPKAYCGLQICLEDCSRIALVLLWI